MGGGGCYAVRLCFGPVAEAAAPCFLPVLILRDGVVARIIPGKGDLAVARHRLETFAGASGRVAFRETATVSPSAHVKAGLVSQEKPVFPLEVVAALPSKSLPPTVSVMTFRKPGEFNIRINRACPEMAWLEIRLLM